MKHSDHITKKKKEKLVKNLNIESAKADSKYFENIMVLTILKLLRLLTIQMTPNESLKNVGYSRWKII